MGRYIVKRLLETLVILFIISIIAFAIIHLIPGDPVYIMLGTDINQEFHDQVYREMGLDRPLVDQYFYWLGRFLTGNFGHSYYFKQEVSQVVAARLPITLYLGVFSSVFSVVIGIFCGVITAVKRGTWLDNIITVLANIGIAMPSFWLAMLLIWLFGIKLRILPTHDFVMPSVNLKLSLQQMVMPVICMSVGGVASYTRQTRSSMLEVIGQDYIRTARSKGLTESRIINKHAIKNALIHRRLRHHRDHFQHQRSGACHGRSPEQPGLHHSSDRPCAAGTDYMSLQSCGGHCLCVCRPADSPEVRCLK